MGNNWTVLSTIWSIIATAITVSLAWRDYRLKRQNQQLEAALAAVRRFDEGTAMSFLVHARALDHESWHLQRLIDHYVGEVPAPDKALQAHARDTLEVAGRVHGMALGNFKTMVRVYLLAGYPISKDIISEWIDNRFIPDFYREWLVPLALQEKSRT